MTIGETFSEEKMMIVCSISEFDQGRTTFNHPRNGKVTIARVAGVWTAVSVEKPDNKAAP